MNIWKSSDIHDRSVYTQRKILGIVLNETEIRLYLSCSGWFGTANGQSSICCFKSMVNTIWYRFDLSLVCFRVWKNNRKISCPRGVANWGHPPETPWKITPLHRFEGLKGGGMALNFTPIMPRDASLSDSGCIFSQSGEFLLYRALLQIYTKKKISTRLNAELNPSKLTHYCDGYSNNYSAR